MFFCFVVCQHSGAGPAIVECLNCRCAQRDPLCCTLKNLFSLCFTLMPVNPEHVLPGSHFFLPKCLPFLVLQALSLACLAALRVQSSVCSTY